jgi:quercetin dioxygenase-like cupin family protein
MLVRKADDLKMKDVDMEGAVGVKMRVLISDEDGAPTFAMREFEIEPGGNTPYHTHNFEHEIYVLSGEGMVAGKEGGKPMTPGVVILVQPNEEHNFKNTGKDVLRFLCLVPNES